MATPIPFGTEFLVNTSTLNDQDTPSVAALANGKFVVVWEYDRSAVGQGNDVMAAVFNADGSKFSVDTVVNQSDAGTHQQKPVVAALKDGRFVVAWEDHDPDDNDFGDTSGSSIRMRIYNNDGTPATNEDLVNNINKEGDQTDPAIAALAGGGFVISWTSPHPEPPADLDIRARAYGTNGLPLASEFGVNVHTDDQTQSTIAGLGNGNYVIAWTDFGVDLIRAQIFTGNGVSAPGTPAGGFDVTSAPAFANPAMAGLSDGGFIITWTSAGNNVIGRAFEADATPAGDQVLAGAGAFEAQSSVAAMAGGQFIVAFFDAGVAGVDDSGSHIGSGVFRHSGIDVVATSDEFLANQTHVNGNQQQPSVATLADGRIIVVWTDPGETPGAPDVSGNSVRARIFDPRTASVDLDGTNLGDDWVGTGFNDIMDGASGNDRIDGGGGNDNLLGGIGEDILIGGLGADAMIGGSGNDTYFADDPADQAIELDGGGIDQVFSSAASFALGANIENLVLTGAAANGTGNALANTIFGNAVANALDGQGGADLLVGFAGNDIYVVDDPGDIADESAAGSDGIDTVLASISFSLSDGVHAKGDIENLTLTGGAANGTGNALANTLVGNALANILDGLAGADTMQGMGGNDSYVVDDPGDVADESAAGSDGIDTVLASIGFSLLDGAHAKGDIENLTLTGAGAINGTGNALANILVGNAGANVLNGLGGNDLLTGGDGADQFLFDTAISKDPAVNLDHVTDFLHGTDKLVLSKSIFKKLELTKKGKLDKDAFFKGKKADDDEDHIVYNKKTGVLAYDKDGEGGKKAIAFAILDGSPDDVSHKDFLIVA